MSKKCIVCKIIKDLSFFGKSSRCKDGHINQCKECKKKYLYEYSENNKDKIKIIQKKYNDSNKDKRKVYYETNKEIIRSNYKSWYSENSESVSNRTKIWYYENKERKIETAKIWNLENKDLVNEYRRNWSKNKRINDPLFAITENIKSSIRRSIVERKFRKKSNTIEILGCSFEEFKSYLESNGELNYGWDIDHIIPISIAKTEDEVLKLNHYTNLQPLCSKINRDIKKDNIECQI
mgnify:CR=1 FL=1